MAKVKLRIKYWRAYCTNCRSLLQSTAGTGRNATHIICPVCKGDMPSIGHLHYELAGGIKGGTPITVKS